MVVKLQIYFKKIFLVDTTHTLVTPEAFSFRIKEALGLSNVEYEKFKSSTLAAAAVKPSDLEIAREKEIQDLKFQALCKDLWPNIYNRLEASEKAKAPVVINNVNDLLTILEKKKAFYDTVIKNDLETIQKANTYIQSQNQQTSSFSAMDAALGLAKPASAGNINIYINGESIKANTGVPVLPEPIPVPTYKSELLMSSYNYPFCTSSYNEMKSRKYPMSSSATYSDILGMKVKTCISDEDEKLLASIQETQDKLKVAQKIENTTDLVDELIDKFKNLQNQMKSKQASIKLQKELECLKKEQEFKRCFTTSLTECYEDQNFDKVFRPRSRSKEIHIHRHHVSPHRSRSRSLKSYSSRESSHSRSLSRDKIPVSILKHHKIVRTKSPGVTFRLKEVNVAPIRSSVSISTSSSSPETFGSRDYFYVAPKVQCWNKQPKKDRNVY